MPDPDDRSGFNKHQIFTSFIFQGANSKCLNEMKSKAVIKNLMKLRTQRQHESMLTMMTILFLKKEFADRKSMLDVSKTLQVATANSHINRSNSMRLMRPRNFGVCNSDPYLSDP